MSDSVRFQIILPLQQLLGNETVYACNFHLFVCFEELRMRMEWMIELIHQQAQATNLFCHSLSHLKKGKILLSKQH